MTDLTKDKNLLDLPILLHDRDAACETDGIIDSYKQELDEVKTENELKAFILRWRNVWLLKEKGQELSEGEIKILEMDFDSNEVLRFFEMDLEKGNESFEPDFEDINVKVMMSIAAPAPLLLATLISSKYGVGSDLGLVRLYLDPYSELDKCCRDGSGDLR
ncbi:hypothetical protein LCGC14_0479480 [marine sediment metagenome]|uniref:Uncharacterized protein n=1 Tax=marine sediment metagenome TaxID=412755 RepID=A0A0F9SSV4_9ZZZZ